MLEKAPVLGFDGVGILDRLHFGNGFLLRENFEMGILAETFHGFYA